MSWNQTQGVMGEKTARNFLKKQGYQILAERYRTRWGEIDLIVTKQNTLYFVEVKSRNNPKYGDPLTAITQKKIQHLSRAAYYFLKKNPLLSKKYSFQLAAIAVRSYRNEEKIEMVNFLF